LEPAPVIGYSPSDQTVDPQQRIAGLVLQVPPCCQEGIGNSIIRDIGWKSPPSVGKYFCVMSAKELRELPLAIRIRLVDVHCSV
jgi:hypothetical protein